MAKRNRNQEANQANNQQNQANNAFEAEFASEFEPNERAAKNNGAQQRRQKNQQ
ncbi:hypothetical protein [Bacillus taeanensis]|uniref:hypothetical protein n=1 Tax=Bacillus taeanensis TaxID=273032 RepID=UPI0015F00BA5|nr:hypothetical protein [Bacillus taeanensis]